MHSLPSEGQPAGVSAAYLCWSHRSQGLGRAVAASDLYPSGRRAAARSAWPHGPLFLQHRVPTIRATRPVSAKQRAERTMRFGIICIYRGDIQAGGEGTRERRLGDQKEREEEGHAWQWIRNGLVATRQWIRTGRFATISSDMPLRRVTLDIALPNVDSKRLDLTPWLGWIHLLTGK